VLTCSIGFDVDEYNELPHARTVSNLFQTNHKEHTITPEPAKILSDLVKFYDQPFPDHSAIPTYYVSKLARENVKVVLSGDGGDENFGGYRRYLRQLALDRVRQRLPKVMLKPFQFFPGDRKTDSFFARAQRFAHQVSVGAREAYLHGMTIADVPMRERLFSYDLRQMLRDYDPLDSFREIYDRAPADDVLSRVSYLDIKTYLVDDILTKVDRASMANSLEVRVPLLDHRVVEFAYSLPVSMKLREGQRKYLLRKVMSRDLPSGHLNLQKKGFSIPMVPWMRGGLKEWGRDVLLSDATNGYLNPGGVRKVWDSFQRGESHLINLISVLLSFNLSAPVWMASQAAAAAMSEVNV
jgi:asparagine synthase (glutamine-hydrolysing)